MGGSTALGSGDGVPPPQPLTQIEQRVVSQYFGHIKDYCRNGAPDVEARRLLPHAQVGGSGVIAVHIHCLSRGFQLRQTLLWNLFVCSPFGCFHFFVTLFEACPNDEDVRQSLDFIRDECAHYLDAGTLHVAIARKDFWDASEAKNTSAKFAIERVAAGLVAEPRPSCVSGEVDLSSAPDVYLVCADCDNVFSTKFPGSLVQHAKRDGPLTLVQFRGSDGGVTGRMAYWSKAYLTLGGYDQDMKGSGSEDVDLRYRFRDMGQGFKVMNGLDENYTKFDAGYSICNDPDGSEKAGLTSHKVKHVDPAFGFQIIWRQQHEELADRPDEAWPTSSQRAVGASWVGHSMVAVGVVGTLRWRSPSRSGAGRTGSKKDEGWAASYARGLFILRRVAARRDEDPAGRAVSCSCQSAPARAMHHRGGHGWFWGVARPFSQV